MVEKKRALERKGRIIQKEMTTRATLLVLTLAT